MIKILMFLCILMTILASMWALDYGERVISSRTASVNQLISLVNNK